MAVPAKSTSVAMVSAADIAICLILPNETSCPILSREHQRRACIALAIVESDGRMERSNFVDALTGRRRSADSELNWMRSQAFSLIMRASILPRRSPNVERGRKTASWHTFFQRKTQLFPLPVELQKHLGAACRLHDPIHLCAIACSYRYRRMGNLT